MHDPDPLLKLLNAEPFNPIRLHLTDGRTVDILNPGLCFIARMMLYYFRAKPDERLAEDVEMISLGHITSVETVSAAGKDR